MDAPTFVPLINTYTMPYVCNETEDYLKDIGSKKRHRTPTCFNTMETTKGEIRATLAPHPKHSTDTSFTQCSICKSEADDTQGHHIHCRSCDYQAHSHCHHALAQPQDFPSSEFYCQTCISKDPTRRAEVKYAKERYVSLGGTSKRHLQGKLNGRATIDSFTNYCLDPSSGSDYKLFTALYGDQEHIIELNSSIFKGNIPTKKARRSATTKVENYLVTWAPTIIMAHHLEAAKLEQY
jgi:hypothetical protein